MSGTEPPTYNSLRSLLAAPKGNVLYAPGDAFLLHVFWEAPSLDAAKRLLSGLRACGAATHRDTPCVPTYFFRLSAADAGLCPPPPQTVGDHPHLRAAQKSLRMGVPPPAVAAQLAKLGIDPALAHADPSAPLPESLLGEQPVPVEFTEARKLSIFPAPAPVQWLRAAPASSERLIRT